MNINFGVSSASLDIYSSQTKRNSENTLLPLLTVNEERTIIDLWKKINPITKSPYTNRQILDLVNIVRPIKISEETFDAFYRTHFKLDGAPETTLSSNVLNNTPLQKSKREKTTTTGIILTSKEEELIFSSFQKEMKQRREQGFLSVSRTFWELLTHEINQERDEDNKFTKTKIKNYFRRELNKVNRESKPKEVNTKEDYILNLWNQKDPKTDKPLYTLKALTDQINLERQNQKPLSKKGVYTRVFRALKKRKREEKPEETPHQIDRQDNSSELTNERETGKKSLFNLKERKKISHSYNGERKKFLEKGLRQFKLRNGFWRTLMIDINKDRPPDNQCTIDQLKNFMQTKANKEVSKSNESSLSLKQVDKSNEALQEQVPSEIDKFIDQLATADSTHDTFNLMTTEEITDLIK